jgi:general secretion pathway protein D
MEKIPTHRSSRTAAILMAAAAVMPLASHVAHAQSLVQQEVARRAAQVQEADAALLEGRKLYAESKYEEAVAQYKRALSLLPSGPAVADRRHAYTGHLVDGSIALTQHYRRVGRYQEARELLTDVLAKDPLNKAAKQQLEYLDDPIRTNPVLTYEHTQDTEKVRKHLYRSEGYYNLGQFDKAEEEYKEVLRIDRYNKAARRGLERVASAKSDYYRAAYDQTRAELLKQVDAAWELTVAPRVQFTDETIGDAGQDVTGALYIRRKLQNIILPVVDFQDVSVDQAVDILRQRARELDNLELDPTKKGVNFVLITPNAGTAGGVDEEASEFGVVSQPGAKTIDSLQLRNVPLEVALQQVCDQAGLRYKVEDYAVKLLPVSEFEDTELYTRSFSVPPDFITLINDGGGGGAATSDDPFADPVESGGGSGIAATPPVKDLLEKSGVVFPDGATASFSRARSALTVRNTANNLDIIEQLVNDIKNQKPKQIRISTKFVEVTQENTDELSFDWILSPVTLNGAATQFLSGGTIGSGSARTGGDFTSPQIPGIPSDPSADVRNIVTAANRSGTYAINRNAIDAFLNNPDRLSSGNNVAPGILSLSGVYGDGQVQMIMRGLSQKRGADIMTAPSIVARSGEKATIEIIREFIYPTEYEPPELPNSVGQFSNRSNDDIFGGGASVSSFPVTPATPTAFETRNTGVILEVEPTLGDDGYTIDLRFAPEIVEFEGFINYGSPIQTSGTDALGNPVSVTITDNRIEMPVFSTRRVNTGLTIYDGHTVAVGGLMSEDVQKVEDKVPVLGDLPLVGRLFQSNAENHTKSNLIIFTTVNIIDATGKSIRNDMGELDATGAPTPGLGGGEGLLPTIK